MENSNSNNQLRMMLTREKLVELIKDGISKCLRAMGDDRLDYLFEDVADYLISNGVTVQEWISVNDRLPEENGRYLTASKRWGDKIVVFDLWFDGGFWYIDEEGDVFYFEVTHWMLLPEPPKEGAENG